MAIERVKEATTLKIVSNYGEVEGKVVKKSKSYASVRDNASDQAIYATYEAITGMQQPTAENCYVVSTEELVKTE